MVMHTIYRHRYILVLSGCCLLFLLVTGLPSSGPAATATSAPGSPSLGTTVYIYHGHNDWVYAAAWSPDGKRIASGSRDNTVQVWDAFTGHHALIYHGHSDVVTSLAWSPGGKRIASGSDDETVQVWDATNGGHAYIYRGYSDTVGAVAWSPDGRRIA
jgi:eukaryotic-like serine/threonine-protein kinase